MRVARVGLARSRLALPLRGGLHANSRFMTGIVVSAPATKDELYKLPLKNKHLLGTKIKAVEPNLKKPTFANLGYRINDPAMAQLEWKRVDTGLPDVGGNFPNYNGWSGDNYRIEWQTWLLTAVMVLPLFRMTCIAETDEDRDILQYKDQGCSASQAEIMEQEIFYREGGDKDPFVPDEQAPAKHLLPTYTLEQVRADHGDRTWVILDGGVYDVTSFCEAHPGGATRIQMVNGLDLETYWKIYTLHDRPHIRALLERYRIGNLSKADTIRAKESTPEFGNYYGNDPKRPKAKEMRIPTQHPWNSEPPLKTLVDHYYTPNDMFFVRNHNNVPDIEPEDFTLEIVGEDPTWGMTDKSYTIEDLRTKFPRVEVIAALQCAGNRQEDFVSRDRPLYVAPHWRNGAIGNAKWAGVRVRDLLRDAGIDVDAVALRQKEYPAMKVVNFVGADTDETGVNYAGVLPFEKVIDPFGDAILAYEMNGETLPRDHGYPIRLLAPGHAGCRNVKWVEQIIVSRTVSELDSGSKLDRHFAPDVGFLNHIRMGDEHLRLDQGPVIQTLPVQSIICDPVEGQILPGNSEFLHIRGVAWSGAGRGVCRVEVSIDDGETFTAAEMVPSPEKRGPRAEAGQGRNWAWNQYYIKLPIPKDKFETLTNGEQAEIEICVRAIDGDFNSQPEKMEQVWNVLGICVNHWHKVKVTLDPTLAVADVAPPAPLPPPAGSPGHLYTKPDDVLGMYQNNI